MSQLLGLVKSIYFRFFGYVAKKRIMQDDLSLSVIHLHLLVTISTGLLMWGYAIVALLYIDNPFPGVVGVVCSLIHNLSPFLYRITKSQFWASFVLLAAGVIHQGTFSFYTGGHLSNILIWYGIIPMLAGIIAGRKAVFVWCIIVISASSVFFIANANGFQFPNEISPMGALIGQAMMVYGWILISYLIISSFIYLKEQEEAKKQEQSLKVTNLLRLLCHDLSSPLSVVSAAIEIFDKVDEDKQKILKEKILASSNGMVDMIKNVKQLYMIDRVKGNYFKQRVSLAQAIHYVELLLEDKLNEKNITLIKDIKVDSDIIAEDTSFKNQVLMNLISNAIKFSSPNSEIFISAYPKGAKDVVVSIADRGIGIPKEIQCNLFKPFTQTHREGTQGEPGSGFGLCIVKNFIDSYGGHVEVDSRLGKDSGTIFTLVLKRA